MPDKHDYATIVGRTSGLEPEDHPGRGLVRNDPPLEFQAALPIDGRNEVERVRNIRALAELMREKWNGVNVALIPSMPDAIRISDYEGKEVFLGLKCKDYTPSLWDAALNPFLILSSVGGVNTAVPLLIKQLSEKYSISEKIRVGVVNNQQQATIFDQQIADLMPILQVRKERASVGSLNTTEYPYILVMIDDLKSCFDSVSNETIRRLASIVTMGSALNVILVVCGAAADIEKLHHVDVFTMNLVKRAVAILVGGNAQAHRAFTTDLNYSDAATQLTTNEVFVVDSGTATKTRMVQE